MLDQSVPEGLHPVIQTDGGVVHQRQFCGRVLEEHEEEAAGEMKCNKLTAISVPIPLCHSEEGG